MENSYFKKESWNVLMNIDIETIMLEGMSQKKSDRCTMIVFISDTWKIDTSVLI